MSKIMKKTSQMTSQASLLSKIESSRKHKGVTSSQSRLELENKPVVLRQIDLGKRKPRPKHQYHQEIFHVPHKEEATARGKR